MGVFEGVGVLVTVWVGGKNWTVCVCATTAVSKMIVSTAPGAEVGVDDPEAAGNLQAVTISTIPENKIRL